MNAFNEYLVGQILNAVREPVIINEDDRYTALGIRSFGRGIFHYNEAAGANLTKLRHFAFPANVLAISNIKGWEGAIAVTTAEDTRSVASSRFLFYAPRADVVDIRYLYYYFLSEPGLAQIGRVSPGSADRNRTLSIKGFEALPIRLPSIGEQCRIATRLDSVLSGVKQVDDLRGRHARLLAAHQESSVSTTSAGATDNDELGKLLHAARSPIDIDESTKYRALGMRSFGKGTIRYPEAAGNELSKLRYFSFPVNALALSNIKAWEGAIDVTSVEDLACVASNRFLFYIAADDRINIRYLRYYLLSKQGLAQISACSPGSADRNRTLSIKSFERIRVPLPSRPEQDRVAQLLGSLSEHLDPVRTDTVVKSLRPSLLNAAFSGQL